MCGRFCIAFFHFARVLFSLFPFFRFCKVAKYYGKIERSVANAAAGAVIAAVAAELGNSELDRETCKREERKEREKGRTKGCHTVFFCVICRMTAAVPTNSKCRSLAPHRVL